MEKLDTLEEFEWIKSKLWPSGDRPDGGEGHTVRHCLPPHFDSYYKLLHPIYIDSSIKDKNLTWDEAKTEFKEEDLEQTTWKGLANEHDVKFVPEISFWSFRKSLKDRLWPRYIIGPEEGNLEPIAIKPLVEILNKYTDSNQVVYFCYFFLATDDWESSTWYLYKGMLKEIHDFEKLDEVRLSPTYWWPANKKWCVCTDYDLDFTLIGGSTKMIQELSESQNFEGFIVNIDTRVDYKGDTANL